MTDKDKLIKRIDDLESIKNSQALEVAQLYSDYLRLQEETRLNQVNSAVESFQKTQMEIDALETQLKSL